MADDVVHLGHEGTTSDRRRVLGECGAIGFVTFNHKHVTCPKCLETELWEELHEIRWAGDDCACASGGGSE